MNITNPIEKHQWSTKVPYHICFVHVLYIYHPTLLCRFIFHGIHPQGLSSAKYRDRSWIAHHPIWTVQWGCKLWVIGERTNIIALILSSCKNSRLSISSNGTMLKHSMYLQNNSATANTSLSSISLRLNQWEWGLEALWPASSVVWWSCHRARTTWCQELGHVKCAMVLPAWYYLHMEIGVGITTPAGYMAWKVPLRWHCQVTWEGGCAILAMTQSPALIFPHACKCQQQPLTSTSLLLQHIHSLHAHDNVNTSPLL